MEVRYTLNILSHRVSRGFITNVIKRINVRLKLYVSALQLWFWKNISNFEILKIITFFSCVNLALIAYQQPSVTSLCPILLEIYSKCETLL